MKRRRFLKNLSLIPLIASMNDMEDLYQFGRGLEPTPRMPVLFLGHGSPMNAIEDNAFSQNWRTLGISLPRPSAILCISAHWETRGSRVTTAADPRTIHDFGGFPKELFEVQYPAPGNPELASDIIASCAEGKVSGDPGWGLDHGCWSVLRQMYPGADVPVVQLSLDVNSDPMGHYTLAAGLAPLREKGVLIIGSGNMVHNLGIMDWEKPDTGFDWAIEANELFKKYIAEGRHAELIAYPNLGKAVQLAVPTPEHYLPLLYILALKNERDALAFFNDKTVFGSISMTAFQFC